MGIPTQLVQFLKKHPRLFLFLKLAKRRTRYYGLRTLGVFGVRPTMEIAEASQLQNIVASDSPPKGQNSQRVLFFTAKGWATHLVWETAVAWGLQARGATCQFVRCDRDLPICDVKNWFDDSPALCEYCASYTRRFMDLAHLSHQPLGAFLSTGDRAVAREIVERLPRESYDAFTLAGLPLGDMIKPSLSRFLLQGEPTDDRRTAHIHKNLLIAAVLTLKAGQRLLAQFQPNVLVTVNGLFFAERILCEMARQSGIRVVTYEVGFLKDTLIFGHDEPVVDMDISAQWAEVKHTALSQSEKARVEAYLRTRSLGQQAVVDYWPSLESDERAICDRLGLDRNKKIVTLFSNILWDTAIYAKDVAFPGMFAWIEETIRHLSANPNVQLIVRVHPAEVRLVAQETREKVLDKLMQKLAALPPNVKIVPPESSISSYVLMRLSDVGLVYTSTVGLELALQGVPVVVAGETHYRGKGFTHDPASRDEYFRMLDEMVVSPHPPSAQSVEMAQRYAHLFFFRFMIPFPLVSTGERQNHFNFACLGDLDAGKDTALDLICEGILEGKDFLLPIPSSPEVQETTCPK